MNQAEPTTTYPRERSPARSCRTGREFGFTFDRSGYRVPAIVVSPWVESGSVYNEEYRHTSLIATLRKSCKLGDAFTQRDASARTFDHVLTRETPRDPQTWATLTALPVSKWQMDEEVVGKTLARWARALHPAFPRIRSRFLMKMYSTRMSTGSGTQYAPSIRVRRQARRRQPSPRRTRARPLLRRVQKAARHPQPRERRTDARAPRHRGLRSRR